MLQVNKEDMVGLTCQLFGSFADLEGVEPEWETCALRLGASVYNSYCWTRCWWDYYGKGNELAIFVVRDSGQVVAVLPFYIESIGWGPTSLRVARLVCANLPPKAFRPVVGPDYAEWVFEQVIRELIGNNRCDLLSYGPFSERHEAGAALAGVGERMSDQVERSSLSWESTHSVFELAPSLDDYLNRLSREERQQRKRKLRGLLKDPRIRCDVISNAASVENEFEEFVELHRQQWNVKGKAGHFGSWPQGLEFNRSLVKEMGKRGTVRFIRACCDGRTVSSQYTFAYGKAYYWELPARALEPEWEKLSLGPSGILLMIEEGIKEGMSFVEGGLARYDYKKRLGATEFRIGRVRILGKGKARQRRFRFARTLQRMFELVYHKIYYRRIMPRLPWTRGRQVSPWAVRLDF